jgi:hypothetical protein
MMEVMEVGFQQRLDNLAILQGGCRLLSKLHFVEPAGKKDKSRVSSSVVTLSNMTSVLREEIRNARLDSSARRSRQIQQVLSWQCSKITCSHKGT